jgi:hypothetical protein
MVSMTDISAKCYEVGEKYHLGPEGVKELFDIALMTVEHCMGQVQVAIDTTVCAPYEKPWGGHD